MVLYLQPTEDSNHTPNFEHSPIVGPTAPMSPYQCHTGQHITIIAAVSLSFTDTSIYIAQIIGPLLRTSIPLSFLFSFSQKEPKKGFRLSSRICAWKKEHHSALKTILGNPTLKGDVPLLSCAS